MDKDETTGYESEKMNIVFIDLNSVTKVEELETDNQVDIILKNFMMAVDMGDNQIWTNGSKYYIKFKTNLGNQVLVGLVEIFPTQQ